MSACGRVVVARTITTHRAGQHWDRARALGSENDSAHPNGHCFIHNRRPDNGVFMTRMARSRVQRRFDPFVLDRSIESPISARTLLAVRPRSVRFAGNHTREEVRPAVVIPEQDRAHAELTARPRHYSDDDVVPPDLSRRHDHTLSLDGRGKPRALLLGSDHLCNKSLWPGLALGSESFMQADGCQTFL